MASFTQRELYGGAITALIPSDYIDASDLRQIPDHQELFLSPTTLTSLIFELNEYQPATTSHDHMSNVRRRPSTTAQDDESASTHHFLDAIHGTDHLDPDSSTTFQPARTSLKSDTLSKFPTYTQTGTILSPESSTDRTRRASSSTTSATGHHHQRNILPLDWATPDLGPNDTTFTRSSDAADARFDETICHQLLVRLRTHGTDLCVRVNVPCKEFVAAHDGAARAREEEHARLMLTRVVESLSVVDFGLFV